MERKIALLSRHNSYIGREFANSLIRKEIDFIFVQIGNYGILDKEEESRSGGKWLPPIIELDTECCKFLRYKELDSICVDELVSEFGITLAIQGDVGSIIRKSIIDTFRDGIINFHPGDLPEFRGCSAPEWQLFEGKNVICTCHYLVEGIDAGDIIQKQQLNINFDSYEDMRASIYPAILEFMVTIIDKYLKEGKLVGYKQDGGRYRNYIGESKIKLIKKQMLEKNRIG